MHRLFQRGFQQFIMKRISDIPVDICSFSKQSKGIKDDSVIYYYLTESHYSLVLTYYRVIRVSTILVQISIEAFLFTAFLFIGFSLILLFSLCLVAWLAREKKAVYNVGRVILILIPQIQAHITCKVAFDYLFFMLLSWMQAGYEKVRRFLFWKYGVIFTIF